MGVGMVQEEESELGLPMAFEKGKEKMCKIPTSNHPRYKAFMAHVDDDP